jgi:hypothetical protein
VGREDEDSAAEAAGAMKVFLADHADPAADLVLGHLETSRNSTNAAPIDSTEAVAIAEICSGVFSGNAAARFSKRIRRRDRPKRR